MPQILQVKTTTPAGEEVLKSVTVLRTFCDAAGAQIFQHTNGVYGYKDGAPVRTKEELAIIKHPLHLKAAHMWWERRGQQMAEKYYTAQLERERARIGDFQAASAADMTELDGKLYYRQPVAMDGDEAVEGPFTWMELFPKRPDWWGQARAIQFMDYQYMLEDMDAPADEAPPQIAPVDPAAVVTPVTTQVSTEAAEAEAQKKAEAAEEVERQALLAEMTEKFPGAKIHPATGIKRLREKYLELQEDAAKAAPSGDGAGNAEEFD